jgi:hypothetical protein
VSRGPDELNATEPSYAVKFTCGEFGKSILWVPNIRPGMLSRRYALV